MSTALALPSLLRKHPIKSTLAISAASFGAIWFHDYTTTRRFMKERCQLAAKYGDDRLAKATDSVRHVTVILNPIAGKRKSRKLYEKWVEPLFNLAGIRVSVFETESPGQATNIMKIMTNCDCVAIVGGDDTVNEVLDGLYARSDWMRASQMLPIAIIPTGKMNTLARALYEEFQVRNQKELMIETAMSLVSGKTKQCNLLKLAPEISPWPFYLSWRAVDKLSVQPQSPLTTIQTQKPTTQANVINRI